MPVTDVRGAEISIDQLQASEHDEALAVLARAFWPDPVFGFFAKTRVQEHQMLPGAFGAFVADAAPFDKCWAARAGDRVVGAAIWVPPGEMPRTKSREAMLQLRVARLLINGRNRVRGINLLAAVDKVHPHEPHWYLALLGTDPLVQGRGAGGRLLQPVLNMADTGGVLTYLETQKPGNIAFYSRHGFTVADEISIEGSPTVWTMRREPR